MNNTTKKVTRKGAGRTKGSFSFVTATIAQMTAANPNGEFKWLISRKQAESLGLQLTTDRIGDLKDSLAGQSKETEIKVQAFEL